MDPETLWADLRQGARNVAGVTWQVNVCVYLLVASYAGDLPFVRITPEGFEDADCEESDGSHTFVQMKEVDAGQGTIAAAGVAEALAHAEASARGSTIVLITDGSLGSRLAFTGWDTLLSQQGTDGVNDVVAALVNRDYDEAEARDIVHRTRLVQLPYRVREISEQLLTQAAACHPTVAGLAVSRLTEIFAVASAAQRRSEPGTAERVQITDVDAVLSDTQNAVDVDGLDEAQSDGICSPADFLTPDAVPARTFYLGVDGRPGHVAANLDVVRPVELTACAEGLADEQSVLVTGPSGAGKSVLLWRAARDLLPSARVVRVRGVQDASDAAGLARHVRLMRPSEYAPILVVADDLGRVTTAAWPEAATLLRELPHTYLLAAARAEDFHPSQLVGSTRVVQPWLDKATALEIGARLTQVGIPERMDVQEALDLSEGLLMEFLALMTTGQRLRQVLAGQVADLADPGRLLQRDIARLLTAAHTLGLSLSAERLGALLAPPGREDTVGDALGVLRDEHIIIDDGTSWRGLHELRSATISELLHENPPPTIGSTWARVVELVDPPQVGWMLRRVAEREPTALPDLLPAVVNVLARPTCTAAGVARVLEGAERADNTRYMQATTPILSAALPPGLNIQTLSSMAYPMCNQDFTMDVGISEAWDRMVTEVRKVADSMPARATFDTTLQQACAGLTADILQRLLTDADLVDVTRILEAAREHLAIPIHLVRALVDRASLPHDVTTAMHYSRLIAACARHVPEADRTSVFGTLHDRAHAIAAADPWTLDLTIDSETAKVRVQRLLPTDSTLPPAMDWDIPRGSTKDILNTETVACLERLVDACPELEQFEITTLTASGTPHRIADIEPAHKDMARAAFPDRSAVRQSVGYQAALRRATASQTWTEVVLAQISAGAELTALAGQIPLRFKKTDNTRRRAEWRDRLNNVRTQLASLEPPPTARGVDPAAAEAHQDDADRTQDATVRALSSAADALDRLCSQDPTKMPRPLATAMDLRSAIDDLRDAVAEGRTVLDHRGSPIPNELIDNLERAANLAAALQLQPAAATSLRVADPLGSGDEIWESARADASARSMALLADTLAAIPTVRIQHVLDPDPVSWSIDARGWLITAEMQDLDAVIAALAGLDETQRDELGTRLVVLAVGVTSPSHHPGSANGPATNASGERPDPDPSAPSTDTHDDRALASQTSDPSGPAGSTSRRVCLDVGFQLGSSPSRPTLPLTPDMAHSWAEAGGIARLQADPASPIEVLETLIARSVQAALSRMRRLPSPAVVADWTQPTEPDPNPETRILDAAPGQAGNDVAQALEILEDQVAAEEAGNASTTLVGLALSAATGGAPREDEEVLLAAMAVLHFARYAELGDEDD
jgi:hypothetical protein